MKKFCSFVICSFLLVEMFMPITSFAVNDEVGLSKAVNIVENILNVKLDEFYFQSSHSQDTAGKDIWLLSWISKNNSKGSINVSVDAKSGDILNMDNSVIDNTRYAKIPKYNKGIALKAAEEFIAKAQPDKLQQLKLIEDKDDFTKKYNFDSDVYTFKFIRVVNGIEYEENGIDISVNKNNLTITNYAYEWDNITFPDSSKVLSLEEAKKSFEEEVGLKLNYYSIYRFDLKKEKTAIVYTLKDINKPIDALTGAAISLEYNDTLLQNNIAYSVDNKFKNYIFPQEIKDLTSTEKMISKDEASEILLKAVNLQIKFKLENSILSVQRCDENPIWYLKLVPEDEKSSQYKYIIGEIDAITSEIKGFRIVLNDSELNTETKLNLTKPFSKVQCKKNAEAFIKQMEPKKLLYISYNDKTDNSSAIEKSLGYVFNYTRKINEISVPNDGISVYVNANTGKVTSFNINWASAELPSAEGVMSIDDAYDNLFKKVNFNLKYINVKDYKTGENRVKLAYVLDDFSGIFDANSGDILDYNCETIKDSQVNYFEDIKGNSAEDDIILLCDMGVLDTNGSLYEPSNKILQKDFIKMIIKACSDVNYTTLGDTSSNDSYDSYYEQAIQRKIISIDEKMPDAEVTREEAAKMLVRALGISYLAGADSIYTLPFNDADKIGSSYKSYVSVATTLKILSGINLCFYPKITLTRGETASIIVNYLKVDPDVK